jgi:hypothetical protein
MIENFWMALVLGAVLGFVLGIPAGFIFDKDGELRACPVSPPAGPSSAKIEVLPVELDPGLCSTCLPACFQVYNQSRQFALTVRAVEERWVK